MVQCRQTHNIFGYELDDVCDSMDEELGFHDIEDLGVQCRIAPMNCHHHVKAVDPFSLLVSNTLRTAKELQR